jgi:hypothetical protein
MSSKGRVAFEFGVGCLPLQGKSVKGFSIAVHLFVSQPL